MSMSLRVAQGGGEGEALESPNVRTTHYERDGYKLGQSVKRKTKCRVSDLATGWHMWECVRHNRHIIECLREPFDEDLAWLRAKRDGQPAPAVRRWQCPDCKLPVKREGVRCRSCAGKTRWAIHRNITRFVLRDSELPP